MNATIYSILNRAPALCVRVRVRVGVFAEVCYDESKVSLTVESFPTTGGILKMFP